MLIFLDPLQHDTPPSDCRFTIVNETEEVSVLFTLKLGIQD